MIRKLGSKTRRTKLDTASYRKLHHEILQRDNWRCEICGSMRNLQVHHLQFRSHAGSDSEENLVTLCATCHAVMHGGSCGSSV